MSPEDRALLRAIEKFAEARAGDVLAAATRDAEERVRALLVEELERSLMGYIGDGLASAAAADVPETPPPPPPPAPVERERRAQRGSASSSAKRAKTPPRAQPPRGRACYAYCVARAGELAPLEGATGVAEGAAVTIVRLDELEAAVSWVPLAQFGEEQLRENLNDLAWLERTARAHEGVLERTLAVATIVPLRLCTIYSSEERVSSMLESEQTALAASLSFLEGRQEWGVKAFAEPAEPEEPQDDPASASGTGYMMQKGRLARGREEAAAAAAEFVADAEARLAEIAVESIRGVPQNPELSGRDGMLLNAALLIERDDCPALEAAVARLREQYEEAGIELEITGPWPPYNFCELS